jgi:hypothetical protein
MQTSSKKQGRIHPPPMPVPQSAPMSRHNATTRQRRRRLRERSEVKCEVFPALRTELVSASGPIIGPINQSSEPIIGRYYRMSNVESRKHETLTVRNPGGEVLMDEPASSTINNNSATSFISKKKST